jgi:hypothetical protein
MALVRRTVIDQIEITRGGGFQIRLGIYIEEDGVEDAETRKWHRTMVWNADEVNAQFAAVNAHLAQMKADKDPPPPPSVPMP